MGAVIFEDNFDGAAGSLPSPVKWTYADKRGHRNQIEDDAQNGGYYDWLPNLAYPGDPSFEDDDFANYKSRTNARMDGQGNLVLTARREIPPDDDPQKNDPTKQFTGCRLRTRDGKRFMPPVRVESRIKFQSQQGLVGTFWMDGSSTLFADRAARGPLVWPRGGEVDIAEFPQFAGAGQTQVQQIAHSSKHPFSQADHWALSSQGQWATPSTRPNLNFHTYRMDWYADRLEFYVDDVLTQPPILRFDYLAAGRAWPFDRCPMFIFLSLDCNRSWTGPVILPEFIEDTMLVDYVRVSKLP